MKQKYPDTLAKEVYKLIEGEHLEENDKSKILIHKDLA